MKRGYVIDGPLMGKIVECEHHSFRHADAGDTNCEQIFDCGYDLKEPSKKITTYENLSYFTKTGKLMKLWSCDLNSRECDLAELLLENLFTEKLMF